MIDANITLGDLIQIGVFLGLIVGYFKGYHRRQSKLDTLLANHDVRIEGAENDIKENKGDIRELRQTKVDKK
ncbi:hypothetical protein LCGC14_1161710 [marine sediment metagenome]|uniref:Uncharacterized protein n=1 Tax=marine sediment metagenome TaxID=412755 RepID=A0A0F9LSA6_9ZZZZ